MALRRCNALRNAALLALRWYVDTMPQAPLLRCFNHFFPRAGDPFFRHGLFYIIEFPQKYVKWKDGDL